MKPEAIARCPWAESGAMSFYHDEEWGVPKTGEVRLFEDLVLDGAQAGLSWSTILKKRENYREAFAEFDPEKVARFDEADLERLMQNPGIVRNRLKVRSAVQNAQAFLRVQEAEGSFARYLWGFVDGRPVTNGWRDMREVPASTPLSDAMSKDLKKRGFNFVGTTIVYAFLQAVGVVNDHLVGCPAYERCRALGESLRVP